VETAAGEVGRAVVAADEAVGADGDLAVAGGVATAGLDTRKIGHGYHRFTRIFLKAKGRDLSCGLCYSRNLPRLEKRETWGTRRGS
jgi:hypothetical protein